MTTWSIWPMSLSLRTILNCATNMFLFGWKSGWPMWTRSTWRLWSCSWSNSPNISPGPASSFSLTPGLSDSARTWTSSISSTSSSLMLATGKPIWSRRGWRLGSSSATWPNPAVLRRRRRIGGSRSRLMGHSLRLTRPLKCPIFPKRKPSRTSSPQRLKTQRRGARRLYSVSGRWT